MDKEFIPYEQALELKELGFKPTPIGGFRQDAVFYYENGNLYYDYKPMYSSTAHIGQMLAPLYQQVFRWFREEYQLYAWVKVEYEYGGVTPTYYITGKRQSDIAGGAFNTYEEAELACLKKLIELVKNK